MSSLPALLLATLSPDSTTRRGAEQSLNQAKSDPSFGPAILALATDHAQQSSVRQSAALCFKNWIKGNWATEDAPTPLSTDTAESLKSTIVSTMISLSASPNLQVQIGEAIAVMAEADFPDKWEGLIEQLVSHLSPTDFLVNNAVLRTAHSIFRRWRAEFRTDDLFLEIKFVLERFCTPYLSLFLQTDQLLSSPTTTPTERSFLLQTLHLLLQLYHDLNSQDLPEFFEDRLPEFMGLLSKYLQFSLPAVPTIQIQGAEEEDEEETDLEKIQAEICDIATLYALRYLDAFEEGGFVAMFVERVWGLLMKAGRGVRYDSLVARATTFLSTIVVMPSKRALFEAPATLTAFCENIILPNMGLRTFEEELFEEDGGEFLRRDLDSGDSETRRQAASDFTRALMEQFENQVTSIITSYIGTYLAQYAADPQTNWKSKDTAIFLLTSIASRGSTVQQGVTSTNALVDVIKFFSDYILADLQAPAGSIHPIIQADAIKFLYTFRAQLTKPQLLSVLPLLVPHLQNESYVIHTYAAITIERILFIKEKGSFLFGQADIRDHAEQILESLFRIIESGRNPQEIASNEHLMKSVMRVIITARQALTPTYVTVLNHLTKIVVEISSNPSNPKFNHFTFESISALIRFITSGNPSTLPTFESTLFPPFQTILSSPNAPEFHPFIFQLLSQTLELHPTLPSSYAALLPPLLTPTLWESRGNIPALVRLLRATLERGAESIVAAGQTQAFLGVFQFLIGSRANDTFGFELLEALFQFLPLSELSKYASNPIFVLLLTRLQTSKTDKFSIGLVRFICFAGSIVRPGLDVESVVAMLDGCQAQPGLFAQVLPVLLPEVQKAPTKDRKIIAVGLCNILTKSPTMLQEPSLRAWTPTLTTLLKLLLLPLPLTTTTNPDDLVIADTDEVTYQASYSKLGASERVIEDPVGHIGDVKEFLAKALVELSASRPGVIGPMMQAGGEEFVGPFRAYLSANGHQIR